MDELIKDMRDLVPRQNAEEDHLVMNSKYIPISLDIVNFHDLKPLRDEMSILFVDGGNSTLFEGAQFCIGFIRTACVTYKNNTRTGRKIREFHIFVKHHEGKYVVKTYPLTSFSDLIFDPEDESLKDGSQRCSPSKIISIIRRYAELEMANSNQNDVDFVVLDGTLEARYPSEEKYLRELSIGQKTCSISKTCSLVTGNGDGIIRKLLSMREQNLGPWYYYPIITSKNVKHKAEIYFAKLDQRSKYVFRFEIQHGFKEKPSIIMSKLSANSNDPIFLGYPYGLIDADQCARVSDEENANLRTRLSMKMGKEWNEFSENLLSLGAHEILDNIRF